MEKQPKHDKENALENSVNPKLSQQPVSESADSQNISDAQLDAVKAKAEDRGFKHETVEDKAALVVREGSMADDPEFEAYAKAWEGRLGILAHRDERAHEVVDEAAGKVLNYVSQKAAMLEKAEKVLAATSEKDDLDAIGKEVNGSGAVGKEAAKIREALSSGSFGSKFAHVSSFINHLLKRDLLGQDQSELDAILAAAGIQSDTLTFQKAFFDLTKGTKEDHLKSPIKVDGEAQNQGLHRSKRFPARGDAYKQTGTRTISEMRGQGINISEAEENAVNPEEKAEREDGKTDTTDWKEGAKVWVMNERNTWVAQMRKLSLPLAAGVSGTTARMVKGLGQLGVGDAETQRLACIGYLLPYNHHSLVEIMTGAAGNGGPAFTPTERMYRDIAPYKEGELRNELGAFPDEIATSKRK